MWFCLLIFIGALALALVVPVDLRFKAIGDDSLTLRLRVEWLYGRVGRDIEIPKREGERRDRQWPSWKQLSLLRQEPFYTRAKLAFYRLRQYVEIDQIEGRARVGLGDPADTGRAFGAIQPAILWLNTRPGVDVVLEPDFSAAALGGTIEGGVRLIPLGLLAHGLAFAAAPETVRTVRRFRSLAQ